MAKNYRKYLSATIATTVAASAAATVVPYSVQADSLKDLVKDAYFYKPVVELINQGAIKGYEDGTFRPYQNVTRGQAAAMIARALKIDQKKVADPGFTDVKKGQRFYNEIAAIFEAGIVDGVTKDKFEPNKDINRAEMSKIIANAFNLKQDNDHSNIFTDVPENSWYTDFVQALYDSGVTVGKTATTYAPAEKVNRGQIATFIYRAQQMDKENKVIESVSDSSIVIDGQTYKVEENLKSLFNSKNAAVLKNALIQFEVKDGTITNITKLEITEDGKSNGHLILDGKNATVKGEVIINGDYVTVKNLTVKGNFTVGSNVKNSFLSDQLVVEGKTIVTDEGKSKVSAASVTTAAVNKVKIVFNNSTLKIVEVNSKDVSLELKGSSSLVDIKVSSNATISADSGVVIPKVTLQAGAKDVEINASVQNLIIESKDVTGLTIKVGAKIGNVTIPNGSKIENMIKNYDQVKKDISKINGNANPDASTGGGGGGGGGGDRTAPDFDVTPTATTGTVEGTIDLSVDLNEAGKVYYVVVAPGETAPSVAYVKAGKDGNGNPAISKGSFGVTKDLKTHTITDLTAGAKYDIYMVAEDNSSNTQAAVKPFTSVQSAGSVLNQTGESDKNLVTVTGAGNITVGPETGTLTLTKGLTISEDFKGTITLRNIVIDGGDLTVNTPNATVVLNDSVIVNMNTNVIDVSGSTFSSRAKHVGHIDMKDSNDSKLELQGEASKAPVIISGKGDIALEGNFNNNIQITGSAKVDIQPSAAVSTLKVTGNATVSIQPNATVSTLDVTGNATVDIKPNAAVSTLQISNRNVTLNNTGTVYEIQLSKGLEESLPEDDPLKVEKLKIDSQLEIVNSLTEADVEAMTGVLTKLNLTFTPEEVKGIIAAVVNEKPATGYTKLVEIKYIVDLALEISLADNKKEADYSKSSWNIFKAALTKAEQVLIDPATSKVDFETALRNLRNAIAGLEAPDTVAPELEEAILIIDGQEVKATKIDGVWKVSLDGLTDDQMFTDIKLNANEAGKGSITIAGRTKEVTLDAAGEGELLVSEILGKDLDPGQDGVSVKTLKKLLGEQGTQLTAKLTDLAGNVTDIKINIITNNADTVAPELEEAILTIGGKEVEATKINGVWKVSLDGLADDQMFTDIKLNANEAGKGSITIAGKTKEVTFDAAGEGELLVSEILGKDLDPGQDGVSVKTLKKLLGEQGTELTAKLTDLSGNVTDIKINIITNNADTVAPELEEAILTIGGKEVEATKINGVWKVSLDGLADDQMFTDIKLNANEAGKGSITIAGKTKEVTFDAAGEGELLVSEILGKDLDPGQDGVSVKTLKKLLGEQGTELTAKLTDLSGNVTNVKVNIVNSTDQVAPVLEEAVLFIGNKEVHATNENGAWKVDLDGLTDDQMFTSIRLNANEAGKGSVTIGGNTKEITLDSAGEGVVEVKDILGDLDRGQDGVSVGKLKELLGEYGFEFSARLTDSSDNSSDIKISIAKDQVLPQLEEAILTIGDRSVPATTNESGEWLVSLDGLADHAMFTKIKLNSTEAGKGFVTIGDHKREVELNLNGEGEFLVSEILGEELDPGQDGVSIGKLKELLGEHETAITVDLKDLSGNSTPIKVKFVQDQVSPQLEEAALIIGDEEVSAKQVGGEWTVNLGELADEQMFTDIRLKVSEAATGTITIGGKTEEIDLENGEGTFKVSDILEELDSGKDGVSVKTLKNLLDEHGAEFRATLTDLNGNDTTVSIKVIVDEAEPVVKDQLAASIQEAIGLTAADYTTESWTLLQTALTGAQSVLANDQAIQTEVDEAYSKLEAALDGLIEAVKVDKTELTTLIESVSSYKADDYSDASWAALDKAKQDAQTVVDNVEAIQTEVDEAYSKLEAALDGLIEAVKVDKTALTTLIESESSLKSEDYSTASWGAFETAKQDAQTVVSNSAATQANVEEAITNLNAAIQQLDALPYLVSATLNIEGKELKATEDENGVWVISFAGIKNSDKFTSVSLDASEAGTASIELAGQSIPQPLDSNGDVTLTAPAGFVVTAETMKINLTDGNKLLATISDKNSNTTAITIKILDLADKTTLQKRINLGSGEIQADYSEEDWAKLQEVLKSAEEVLEDREASQAKVDNVTNALTDILLG